jgi:tetratricopeptide (TPR) repeat protein
MTEVRRLLAVGAVLALGTVITCSQIWGEPAGTKAYPIRKGTDNALEPREGDPRFSDDLAPSKFADNPVLLYTTRDKHQYFSLQVKPQLDPVPQRPRDILIAIDNSASQARGPLATSIKLAENIIANAAAEDRFAIWTINIHATDLTNGFKAPADLGDALKVLRSEIPLGATNLNSGLTKAISSFPNKDGRQQALLFMGDGMSVVEELKDEDLAKLADDMVAHEIGFYPVPLGLQINSKNLHSLVSGTGGAPIRVLPSDQLDEVGRRFRDALLVPVIYSPECKMCKAVSDFYPTKLPPLRADTATLVAGTIEPKGDLTATIKGNVVGKSISVSLSFPLPEAESDNYFLVGLVDQWKQGNKDRPALIPANRVLPDAALRNRLAIADLVAEAEWAMQDRKYEAATNLFEQALKIDSNDKEAAAGRDVAEKLRTGRLSPEKLEQLQPKGDDALLRLKGHHEKTKLTRDQLVVLLQQEEPKKDAGAQAPADALKDVQARQEAEAQRVQQLVREAISTAERTVKTSPDATHDDLKKLLDIVHNNADLPAKVQQALEKKIQDELRNIDRVGVRIKQRLETEAANLAHAKERERVDRNREMMENHIVQRIRTIHDLMNVGRDEEANRQSQVLREDLLARGEDIPVAATAAYHTSLNEQNLRDLRDLQRLRQERWLLTLMQVERSAIPFPDEPPVQFPPAATWKALTELRKDKYEFAGFGPDTPRRTLQLRDFFNKVINYDGTDDPKTKLIEILDELATQYNVTFDVNERAFEAAGLKDVLNSPMVADGKPIPKMKNVTFATVLRKILSRIPNVNATALIRRDTIEITTLEAATFEKTVRAYPVADLVTPIPNAFNQQSVLNQATILGVAGSFGAAGGFGALGGGLGALGALGGGGLGALGGGLGALGALGGGLGALGALGGGLGALGALGGGLGALGGGLGALGGGLGALGGGLGALGGGLGALGGGLGAFGGGGLGALGGGLGAIGGALGAVGGVGGNLGVGGGALGGGAFGFGGQLGQLGNLGGQFGLQGGNQSLLLIVLIRQVIGTPKDWSRLDPFSRVQLPKAPGQQDPEDELDNNAEANAVGFFPPAQALVVKGTSRIHTRYTSNFTGPNQGPPMGALNQERDDRITKIEPGRNRDKDRVGGDGDKKDDPKDIKDGKKDQDKDARVELDPKVIWQDALEKGVDNPGLIIAVADFLAQAQKFDHCVEFLKANLRQGIVVRPWVYEALAQALRETNASPEEIERAMLSAADLEPLDAAGYLKASTAMAENKHYEVALAFAKQASGLQPNIPQPFEAALDHAVLAKDTDAMEWAAGHLLRQDWPVNNQELHDKARVKLDSLAKTLSESGRKEDAERMLSAVNIRRQRDLVIRANWQGEADVDLKVKELPTSSVCSCLNRQTVNGGILIGDNLSETNSETYIAAQAFSGEYEATIERVWGHPVGDKVQVEIIQHQGTNQETRKLVTVKPGETIKVTLESGSRKALAQVPPPAVERPTESNRPTNPDRILYKLRDLSENGLNDGSAPITGGVGSYYGATMSAALKDVKPADRSPAERVAFQTKVSSFAGNGADFTLQGTISPDQKFVRYTMSPVFSMIGGAKTTPVVNNPLLPGSPAPKEP